MILQIEEGFAIDLGCIESIQQSGKSLEVCMESGKQYIINFDYKAFLGLWKRDHGKLVDLVKNIDSNTFSPRI